MTATPDLSEAGPDCTAVVDDFARRLPGLKLASLQAALQVLQLRLGTSAEEPCDLERAQALGHEINNRLTAAKIETDPRPRRWSDSF